MLRVSSGYFTSETLGGTRHDESSLFFYKMQAEGVHFSNFFKF